MTPETTITLLGNGSLTWAAGLRIGVLPSDNNGLPVIYRGDLSASEILMRYQWDQHAGKTFSVRIDNSNDAPFGASLVCIQQGCAVPLLCPKCGGNLHAPTPAMLKQVAVPEAGGEYIACTHCGATEGVYCREKSAESPDVVKTVDGLIQAWRVWAKPGCVPSPKDSWSCGSCLEKTQCYANDAKVAVSRLAIFSLRPFLPVFSEYLPWKYDALTQWLADISLASEQYSELRGLFPGWEVANISSRARQSLGLRLFDSVVGKLAERAEKNTNAAYLVGDSPIRVSVAGSLHVPHFTVDWPEQPAQEPAATDMSLGARCTSAKIRVIQAGKDEQPFVEAILYSPEFVVGQAIEILANFRKDDGLPTDVSLRFVSSGQEAEQGLVFTCADPLVAPLIQYFKILRVVPPFDIKIEIVSQHQSIVRFQSPIKSNWQKQLSYLWFQTLFPRNFSAVKSELENLETIPFADNSVAVNRLRGIVAAGNDSTISDLYSQNLIECGVALWMGYRELEKSGGVVAVLDALREKIALCLAFTPVHAAATSSANAASLEFASPTVETFDPDKELLAILKELEIDSSILDDLNFGNSKGDRANQGNNMRMSAVDDGVSLDSTLLLTREQIARFTQTTSVQNTLTKEPGKNSEKSAEYNFDETLIISPKDFQSGKAVTDAKGKLPSIVVDTDPALDETLVITHEPQSR